MRYAFGLSKNGTDYRTANPLGYRGVKYSRSDEGFFYRTELTGELTFTGEDYHWLKQRDEEGCGTIYFKVTEYHRGRWPLFEGVASIKSFSFDPDSGIARGEFQPNDEYKCIFDDWETDYNIFDLGLSTYTVEGAPLPLEFDVATSTPSGGGWANVLTVSGSYNLYIRELAQVLCDTATTHTSPPGSGWALESASCTTTGFAEYSRDPSNYYELPTEVTAVGPFVSAPSSANTPSSEAQYSWLYMGNYQNGADYYAVFWDCPYIVDGDASSRPIDNSMKLVEVLEALIQQACPSLSLSSHLLNYNGNGDRPDNRLYDRTIFELENPMLVQLTDFTNAGASQNATYEDINLKEVLEWCSILWDTTWWIEGTDFVLENKSAISQTNHRDVTANAHKRFSYDTEELQRKDVFDGPGTHFTDFIPSASLYTGDCLLDDNVNNLTLRRLYTDFHGVLKDRNSVGTDGFMLIAAIDNTSSYSVISGDPFVMSNPLLTLGASVTTCSGGSPVAPSGDGWTQEWEDCATSNKALYSRTDSIVGRIDGRRLANTTLSLPWLQQYYHIYDRPSLTGTVNGSSITFESVKRYKVQEQIIFTDEWRDFDPRRLYRGPYGWAEIIEATRLPDGRTRLNLKYDA